MPKPRIMFYHDGRHPLIYMYEPPMKKEEYESAIDELAGTPVEAVIFCLGEGRVFLHDTKVAEFWGHNVDKWRTISRRRTHLNAKHLIEEGNDPLRLVCERAHAKDMLLYPSLIVQRPGEVAGETTMWERSSAFRFNNPQLEIGARGDVDPNFLFPDNLDFKHKEARDERFAVIEEVVNNYPVDGFELQLQHRPQYFRPDEVEEGRAIMTDWISQVHDAVKKSGPDRELAVRIPHSIEGCLSVGLDIREWVRQGVVDVIIAQDVQAGRHVNSMADFRPMVALAKGSESRVIASIPSQLDTDRLGDAPISVVRAAACNYWEQGINGVDLWYWYLSWPYQPPFYEKLRELPHPDVMAPKDKFYHLLTDVGLAKPGEPGEQWGSRPLPVRLHRGQPVGLELTISDDLPRWDKDGRVHEVLLRVRVTGTTEMSQLGFRLNGADLPQSLMRRINEVFRMTAARFKIQNSNWFIFRLDRVHWPAKGPNSLEVTLVDDDPDIVLEPSVHDVELEIKYLMGQSFHRGFVDPDLGTYEHVEA